MTEPQAPGVPVLAEIVAGGTTAGTAKPPLPTVVIQGQVDERALTSVGQRKINLIWEVTQAVIAIAVVFVTLAVTAALALQGRAESAFVLLVSLVNLVIGFYFGRTNHQRVGGVSGVSDISGR